MCDSYPQVSLLQDMQSQLLCIHICAEALRIRTAQVGAEYRVFLAWLMRMWQLLMASNAETEAAPKGGLLGATAVGTVMKFLTEQLVKDCVGAQMFGKVKFIAACL